LGTRSRKESEVALLALVGVLMKGVLMLGVELTELLAAWVYGELK
jgi:hypothetical protein